MRRDDTPLTEAQRELIQRNYRLALAAISDNLGYARLNRIDEDDMLGVFHMAFCIAARRYDKRKAEASTYFMRVFTNALRNEATLRRRGNHRAHTEAMSLDEILEYDWDDGPHRARMDDALLSEAPDDFWIDLKALPEEAHRLALCLLNRRDWQATYRKKRKAMDALRAYMDARADA